SSLPLGYSTLTFLVYCAPKRRPFESMARPAACSESSTSVVIFPSGSNLTTPPLAVAIKLPSGSPTPASEPLRPEATISIFVPAFTTPGISGVTLSVAGGCAASWPPRPPRPPRPPSRPWRSCACASSVAQQTRQITVNRDALDRMAVLLTASPMLHPVIAIRRCFGSILPPRQGRTLQC